MTTAGHQDEGRGLEREGPLSAATVVIVHADRGRGLLLARALAEVGITVVMHSTAESQAIADLMGEIVDDGGHAAAIQSDLTDPNHPGSLFPGMARFLGPVTGVVLAPVDAEDGAMRAARRRHPSPAELESAAEVIRWARALATALPRGRAGTIVGVMPVTRRDDPARAVAVGAWEGALGGLRRELAPRGVRVHVVPLGESGRSSRAAPDPVVAARRVAHLMIAKSGGGDDVNGMGPSPSAEDAGVPTGGMRPPQGRGRGAARCR